MRLPTRGNVREFCGCAGASGIGYVKLGDLRHRQGDIKPYDIKIGLFSGATGLAHAVGENRKRRGSGKVWNIKLNLFDKLLVIFASTD